MNSSYSLRQEPRRDEPELPRLDVEELRLHLDVEELLHHLDIEELHHLLDVEDLGHDELILLNEQLRLAVTSLRDLLVLQGGAPSFRMSPCLANKVPKPQPTPPRNKSKKFLQASIFLRTDSERFVHEGIGKC